MNYKHQFFNDYAETAHPDCLAALSLSPLAQEAGYGNDSVCAHASALIKARCAAPDAAVHFLSGGTQTNLTFIAAALRPHEAVIAPLSGHIYANETGAIEATGHKVIGVEHAHGKIIPAAVRAVFDKLVGEHTLRPRMLFISQATEVGTVYTLNELNELRVLCDELNLYFYIDGARLGAALKSQECDWTLADIARLADAFYIGGTKNGALLGEALVIVHADLQNDFRYAMKQRGALLAKSRSMGSQFQALFQNDLFERCAAHANACAQTLQAGFVSRGYPLWVQSSTNQIFPILPNDLIASLQSHYGFYVWQKIDAQHSAIRLVTSWATPMAMVEQLLIDVSPTSTS